MEILTRKKIISIGITTVLLIGLVVGVVLVQRQQTLKSRASLQAYNAFNVASSEPGKYVSCSGNVCETNTLNITISVADLQALNIQDQQVASQQCVWQPAPLRCTGCGVASILEQESCTQEIRVTADDVASEECNLPEWCGSYVTQNTTERPPEQIPEPSPEPQGGPQPVCEEKSYCDDNLGLRVFWNTCQGTPVKEAEFDRECIPAEQQALNEKLRQEAEIQAQTQTETQPQSASDLAKQLEQEEQVRIEAKKAETANIPQNVANFVGGLPGGIWGGISSLWESQQQKPPDKNILEKLGDNGMILLKLAQSFAEQGRRDQEIYNQKVTPQCQVYLQSSYASGGVVFHQGDNPCAYLEGQKLKTDEEAAAEAEKAALENGLTAGLANLQVNMDVSEEKRNFTLCFSPLLCPSIEVGVPADVKVTFADLMRKNQVVELSEKLGLDLNQSPNEWDPAKREYFFKVIAKGDINPSKALAEFLVPVTSLENLQVSKRICEKKYQGNCIVSSDNILGIVNMSDQDIEQANQIAPQLYPQFTPAPREKVREYAKILYSDPTINDQYLSEAAKVKYDRQIAQSLGVSPEELLNIKNTFKVYGQVGDHIRNNTSEGRLFQQDQNTAALEGSIAVVTSLPAADLAMEGLILGVRKVAPKVLSVLIRDYGDDVAKKIVKDVESVAERGGRSMSAAEAASVRKAEAALVESSGDDLVLAATPVESLDNLVRGGGLDNDAAAAVRAIRNDPNLDQTATQGLKAAQNGAGKLDDAVVVIPDGNAGFIAPDRQLADVADNLEGAEARLLGEAPPPPNPAGEMLADVGEKVDGVIQVLRGGPDQEVELKMARKALDRRQLTPELQEVWESAVRDTAGRFEKYEGKVSKGLYQGVQPTPDLNDPFVVSYLQHTLDAREDFLAGLSRGRAGGTIDEFKAWIVELHQKQAYKPSQKPGELMQGITKSGGTGQTPIVLQDVVEIAEKYGDSFANNIKNPPPGRNYKLILSEVEPTGWPQDVIRGDTIEHLYPPATSYDSYFGAMQTKLNKLQSIGLDAPIEVQLKTIAEFYQYAINARMFTEVNQSLYMNMVNGLLKERGLKPIEHGILDFVAMRLQPDNFARYFTDEVLEKQGVKSADELEQLLIRGRSLAPCPIFSLIPIAYAQGPTPCPKGPLAALARNAGNIFERFRIPKPQSALDQLVPTTASERAILNKAKIVESVTDKDISLLNKAGAEVAREAQKYDYVIVSGQSADVSETILRKQGVSQDKIIRFSTNDNANVYKIIDGQTDQLTVAERNAAVRAALEKRGVNMAADKKPTFLIVDDISDTGYKATAYLDRFSQIEGVGETQYAALSALRGEVIDPSSAGTGNFTNFTRERLEELAQQTFAPSKLTTAEKSRAAYVLDNLSRVLEGNTLTNDTISYEVKVNSRITARAVLKRISEQKSNPIRAVLDNVTSAVQNTGRQVRDTVGGWVDNVLNRFKKKEEASFWLESSEKYAQDAHLGQKLGSGVYSEVYDTGHGTVVKLFEFTSQTFEKKGLPDINLLQIEAMKTLTAQYPDSKIFPKFIREISAKDSKGNIAIRGFEMEKIEGETLREFAGKGGVLDRDQIERALAEHKRITDETDIPFGDVARTGSNDLDLPSGVRTSNIMVTPEGEIVFIDIQGYETLGGGAPKNVQDEQEGLKQLLAFFTHPVSGREQIIREAEQKSIRVPDELLNSTKEAVAWQKGLTPCPIKFGLIPVALAQEPGGLNPCPKNPLAAMARNAGNTFKQAKDGIGGIFERSTTVTVAGEKRQITAGALKAMDKEQLIALFDQVLENGDLKEVKSLSQMITKSQGKASHQIDEVVGGGAVDKYYEQLAQKYPAEFTSGLIRNFKKRAGEWERKLADKYDIEIHLFESLEDQVRFINKEGTALLPFSYAGAFAYNGKVYMIKGSADLRNTDISLMHELAHVRVQKSLGVYTASGADSKLEGFYEGAIEWVIQKLDPKSRYVLTSRLNSPAYVAYRDGIEDVVKKLNVAGANGEKMMMEFFVTGDPQPIFDKIGKENIHEVFDKISSPSVINGRYISEAFSAGVVVLFQLPQSAFQNAVDTVSRIINIFSGGSNQQNNNEQSLSWEIAWA